VTPAIKFLDQHRMSYQALSYQPSPGAAIGIEAASQLGLNPDQVLKTLVVMLDNNKLAVAIVPVTTTLRLSALGKVAGSRSPVMATPEKAERAGRRGMMLEVAPQDLQKACSATACNITSARL
jgi:Cys-tRNA(Pro)/Cys-tRNA(Cys) deacylase